MQACRASTDIRVRECWSKILFAMLGVPTYIRCERTPQSHPVSGSQSKIGTPSWEHTCARTQKHQQPDLAFSNSPS